MQSVVDTQDTPLRSGRVLEEIGVHQAAIGGFDFAAGQLLGGAGDLRDREDLGWRASVAGRGRQGQPASGIVQQGRDAVRLVAGIQRPP